MLKVGITGGIGSGKSVICELFALLGIPVFNSDSEAKKIMKTDEDVKVKLKQLLGNKAYSDKGLNRKYIRDIAFRDSEILKKINQIVHPAVRKHFLNWCTLHSEKPFVIQEAAIIFESGAYRFLDFIVTVYAPENVRIERTMLRDGISGSAVKSVIENQLPDDQKLKQSDDVIHNYDPYLVLPQVIEIHKKLVRFNRD